MSTSTITTTITTGTTTATTPAASDLRPDRRRVVVADESREDRARVTDALGLHGFAVTETSSALRALELVAAAPPDAVVVDLRIGGHGGLDLLRDLQRRPDLVVIAVGEGPDEIDCVTALELGAHDFVAKPVPARELVARLRAALRRQQRAERREDPVRRFGPMSIDLPAKEVRLDDEPVPLTAREFELLAFMSANPRRVYSREQLLEHVWGSRADWQSLGTVSEHVRRVRRKLGCDGSGTEWIRTLRGAGYRFEPA